MGPGRILCHGTLESNPKNEIYIYIRKVLFWDVYHTRARSKFNKEWPVQEKALEKYGNYNIICRKVWSSMRDNLSRLDSVGCKSGQFGRPLRFLALWDLWKASGPVQAHLSHRSAHNSFATIFLKWDIALILVNIIETELQKDKFTNIGLRLITYANHESWYNEKKENIEIQHKTNAESVELAQQ